MTYTRAASAASSLRAKQELVRLLFGPQYFRQGREAHKMLDHSIYTHSQLKNAYLQRIQELHPDKRRHNQVAVAVVQPQQHQQRDDSVASTTRDDTNYDEFISLREAWSRYEEFAKALAKVDNGSREADFTMFGVGCSFSDNEAERDKRSEITDQACRGWFFAGELGAGETNTHEDDTTNKPKEAPNQQSSLLDDDMFVLDENVEVRKPATRVQRKSLIDHMMGKRGWRIIFHVHRILDGCV